MGVNRHKPRNSSALGQPGSLWQLRYLARNSIFMCASSNIDLFLLELTAQLIVERLWVGCVACRDRSKTALFSLPCLLPPPEPLPPSLRANDSASGRRTAATKTADKSGSPCLTIKDNQLAHQQCRLLALIDADDDLYAIRLIWLHSLTASRVLLIQWATHHKSWSGLIFAPILSINKNALMRMSASCT